ncbi:uncharacterized protein LOC135469243 [Liolophura sinensis]|uniref:uncharacterized protein LOC135469243 n=1 Tax=Liolophura sinensis TaxID=3198878 RepID=UPI003158B4F4
MSQFTTGYRTMERRHKEAETEGPFCDSETLLLSAPSSPDIWNLSTRTPSNGTHSASRQSSTRSPDHLSNTGVHFAPILADMKSGPPDPEDVEQGVALKEEISDWRRSAVLTVFIFPPTGLVAMILACLSYRSAKNGDLDRARRLNCCSCWLVFISLLSSLLIIMFVILLRLYGYIKDPFG